MASTKLAKGKTKELHEEGGSEMFQEGSSSSGSEEDLDSQSDSGCSDSDSEEVSQDFLDSLLDLARKNAQNLSSMGKRRANLETEEEEEVIQLDDEEL